MIEVLIPQNHDFAQYKNECKILYENLQDKIGDSQTFDFITNNTFFYLFLNDKKLIGGIYYFLDKDKKLFLNGFAKRKQHNLCLECLKMSLNWFKGRIYAEAQNRASALCLIRCGFKREKDNIFYFEKGFN